MINCLKNGVLNLSLRYAAPSFIFPLWKGVFYRLQLMWRKCNERIEMRRCKPLKIIPPVAKLNKLVLYLLVYIKRQGYVIRTLVLYFFVCLPPNNDFNIRMIFYRKSERKTFGWFLREKYPYMRHPLQIVFS